MRENIAYYGIQAANNPCSDLQYLYYEADYTQQQTEPHFHLYFHAPGCHTQHAINQVLF
jgi:hypothetical protein